MYFRARVNYKSMNTMEIAYTRAMVNHIPKVLVPKKSEGVEIVEQYIDILRQESFNTFTGTFKWGYFALPNNSLYAVPEGSTFECGKDGRKFRITFLDQIVTDV